MVAQGYAVRFPQRVANLILIATAPSHRFIDDARRLVEEYGPHLPKLGTSSKVYVLEKT